MNRLFSLLLPAAFILAAAPPPKTTIDAGRVSQITARMQAFVDKGTIAGAVGLASRRGEIVYFDAVGYQDLEAKKPMRKDSIFQIMSMTKPIVGIGVMMLAEEGRLSLADPVEKHLPEFRGQFLVDSASADGQSRLLKRPSRPITIRDLMTHTSGLPSGPPESAKDLNQRMNLTLAGAVALFSQMPLAFEPGTKWMYSNAGIATLGRILEVASGEPFEKFMEERIFKPLGMKDSFFFPPQDKVSRISMVYKLDDGRLKRSGGDILGGDPSHYRKGARYPAPEFGLYSTASDLLSVYQMMLSGGVSREGKRLLSPASVEVMTRVHTGTIEPAGHTPGWAYGLTWTVASRPASTLNLQSIGTYGHGGAFGTQGWIDPKKELIGVFLIQRSSGGDPDESRAFTAMINASVVE
jgi:CubicO group peptidase (beta-lactamase class C family)